jgi:hypothetical protein
MVPPIGQANIPDADTTPASGVLLTKFLGADHNTSLGFSPSGTINSCPTAKANVSLSEKVLKGKSTTPCGFVPYFFAIE